MDLNKKLCSECFKDEGLKLLAERIGVKNSSKCPNCSSSVGIKINPQEIETLAYRFFVVGSILKLDYGGAPRIQFNKDQKTSIVLSDFLQEDIKLFEKTLGIGFFSLWSKTLDAWRN